MTDALAANTSVEKNMIAYCLAYARRKVYELKPSHIILSKGRQKPAHPTVIQ
jgi:hypothetical protein